MRLTAALFLAIAVLMSANSSAKADIPSSMNVQGKLTDATGAPLPPGPKTFTFKIFNAAVGGDELWPIVPGENQVIETNAAGLWNAQIGSIMGIPDFIFTDTAQWLEITVDDGAGAIEIFPRVRLLTNPSAFQSVSSETAIVAIIAGPNSVNSSSIIDGSVAVEDIDQNGAAVGQVLKWDGSQWGAADDETGAGGDGDWDLVGNVLWLGGSWGLSRSRNAQFGAQDSTHTNFGVASTTGAPGQNNAAATVSGGMQNVAAGEGATVGGGRHNRARGPYSVVAGGGGPVEADSNSASADRAAVLSGSMNRATAIHAVISGGQNNSATGNYSAIMGGQVNLASGHMSVIGGGDVNETTDAYAAVVGGSSNVASGNSSFVGGGNNNRSTGLRSTIAGGGANRSTGSNSFVGGGIGSYARGDYSVIGGGGGPYVADSNSAVGEATTIGGGRGNATGEEFATVGGGLYNEAKGQGSTVAGGWLNKANSTQATVGGGSSNTASGLFSTVAGGDGNSASGTDAAVSGGSFNTASNNGSNVSGGGINRASGSYSTVGGGAYNTASGTFATIAGGGGTGFPADADTNTARGDWSMVPGGKGNAAAGDYSFAGGRRAIANHPGAFVWADSNNTDFLSIRANEFAIGAEGGLRVEANSTLYGGVLTNVGNGDGLRLYGNVSLGNNYGALWAINSGSSPTISCVAGSGDAAYFNGNVTVTGAVSKAGGSFKIDHPLDPTNKYLYHSFVESPDMMNVYNGNITTDADGFAVVALPDYFDALNRDFRYQLTVIGQFAQAIVAEEISGNQFTIRTDKPNVKVSWHVTGIRQDAYANAHRIPVEAEKPAAERGTYLHPVAHGQPVSRGVQYVADKDKR